MACLLWAAAFCFPENLGAVTKTWVGGNGNWSVATNWSPLGVPTAADDVVINSGTATLDVSTTIASLAMGGSGGLVGTNDLSVSGDFTLTSYGFNLGGTLTVNGNFFFGAAIIGNGIVGGTMIINGMTNVTDPAYGGHWIRKKTFLSNGGILWTGGNIGVTDGGIWKLAAGATFTEQNTDGNTHLLYDNFGGGGTFENNGTFIRNGTAPLAIGGGINGQNFDNFGTIVGQSAQFGFSRPGVFTNKPSGIIAGTKKISFGGGFLNLGTIAPGYNSIGTLPLDRPAGIPISTLNIEIAAPGSVDKLEITGNVDLAGATLNVTETPCLPNGNYTFLTWTGTRTGNFGTPNLPPGYSVTYNDALKKAELVYLDPPPTIACPANTTLNTSPGLCEATSPAIGSATVQDNCPDATSTNNAPASLLVGTSTVIWTATDSKGSTAACLQTVEIQDAEQPTITCPTNISANADAGFCSTTLPISAATAADNCAISTNLNDAPATFPVGTTTVTHTATDIHGNTSVCAQTVTVNDAENPSITCPADLTVTATPGICTASPTIGRPPRPTTAQAWAPRTMRPLHSQSAQIRSLGRPPTRQGAQPLAPKLSPSSPPTVPKPATASTTTATV